MNTDELTTLVHTALDDLKGIDITVLDVHEKTSVTDNMVICTGSSVRHVKSLANEVIVKCKEVDVAPLGSEGESQGDWVLIDLGDVVVGEVKVGQGDRRSERNKSTVRRCRPIFNFVLTLVFP